jgi:hypothetical protein
VSDLIKQKQRLLSRFRTAQIVSFHISRDMWNRLEVPVEMCVKQRKGTEQWETLRVMLGGCRA